MVGEVMGYYEDDEEAYGELWWPDTQAAERDMASQINWLCTAYARDALTPTRTLRRQVDTWRKAVADPDVPVCAGEQLRRWEIEDASQTQAVRDLISVVNGRGDYDNVLRTRAHQLAGAVMRCSHMTRAPKCRWCTLKWPDASNHSAKRL